MASTETQDALASMFNITRGNVQFIQSGKSRVRIFRLERQRIKVALEKASRPLMPKEIQVAARLRSQASTQSILMRMLEQGLLVRTQYGFYALPERPLPPSPSIC